MKDQINASKIFHSSAIYIQSMKITRSLYKKVIDDILVLHCSWKLELICNTYFSMSNEILKTTREWF